MEGDALRGRRHSARWRPLRESTRWPAGMRRCGCNAIPLSDRLASADDWLMATGMFLLAFDLLRQRPAMKAQKSAPPAK